MREGREKGGEREWREGLLGFILVSKTKTSSSNFKVGFSFSYLMNNKYFGFRTSIDVVAGVWIGAAKRWNQMF